jgi:hypothetical protein
LKFILPDIDAMRVPVLRVDNENIMGNIATTQK